MAPIIDKLPDSEKKVLALCGITQDSQLAQVEIEALLADLGKAQRFFPQEASALSAARLRQIHAQACDSHAEAQQREAEMIQETEPEADDPASPAEGDALINTGGQITPTRQAFPSLSPRRHQHRHRPPVDKALEQQRKAPTLAQSVHCGRPIATYIGAITMLMFYAGLTAMFLIPLMLFLSYIREDQIFRAFFLSAMAMVPYFLHGLWLPCTVCNMKFFMLRHYNKNRHAHSVPLLGLTSAATALHIVFLLWYRCPACGTSIRLYRRRHSSR